MRLWKLGMTTFATGLALGLVSVSHAQIAVSPVGNQLMVTCQGGAAAATIDLTSSYTGEVTSPDANYTCSGCRRFVVDIKLPTQPNYVASKMLMPNVTTADALSNQATCEAAQLTVHYWRKTAGATSFTSVGGGTSRGVWTGNTGGFGQNTCNLSPITGFVNPNLGTIAAGDVWRVDVGAAVHSLPVKVKVGAMLQGILK